MAFAQISGLPLRAVSSSKFPPLPKSCFLTYHGLTQIKGGNEITLDRRASPEYLHVLLPSYVTVSL